MPSNNDRLLEVPGSKINPDFGISVGRGMFNYGFSGGVWKTVATRVKLNEVGREDGMAFVRKIVESNHCGQARLSFMWMENQ